MNAHLSPTPARLKQLEGDVFRIICGAPSCDAPLGYVIHEDVLTGEIDRTRTADEQDVIRLVERPGEFTIGAFIDQEALQHDRVESPSTWRIVPPPADPRHPDEPSAFRQVADGEYTAIGPRRRADGRARRPLPTSLAFRENAHTVRGVFPQPPAILHCRCGRRNLVSIAAPAT